jgi:hypothetical protein
MAIRVRVTPDAPPIEVATAVDLESLVKRGVVTSGSLVLERILTDGRWITADNLRLFHAASPRACPKGPELLEQERREDRRQAQREAASRAFDAYRNGDMIENSFGLERLGQLRTAGGFVAATRLIIKPSFEPERIVSLFIAPSFVDVVMSESPSSVWNLVPQHECRSNDDGSFREIPREPFFREQVRHISLRAPYGVAVEALGDPQEFLHLGSTPLAKREWMVLDGMGFRHRVEGAGHKSDVAWDNPASGVDVAPLETIARYRSLATKLGHPDFVPNYAGIGAPPKMDPSKFKP